MVEEIISFSALDNIRDLTCVSFFAVCFDDVMLRLHLGKQAREIVQTFHKPTVLPNQKKVNKISKAFLSGHQPAAVVADIGGGEPVYIETSEKQQEEIIITLNIGLILFLRFKIIQNYLLTQLWIIIFVFRKSTFAIKKTEERIFDFERCGHNCHTLALFQGVVHLHEDHFATQVCRLLSSSSSWRKRKIKCKKLFNSYCYLLLYYMLLLLIHAFIINIEKI